MSEDRINFSLPAASGWKSLIVYAVIIAAGAVTAAWPDAVGAASSNGVTAMAIGVLATLLRMITAGPVAEPVNLFNVQPKGESVRKLAVANYAAGFDDALKTSEQLPRIAQSLMAQAQKPVTPSDERQAMVDRAKGCRDETLYAIANDPTKPDIVRKIASEEIATRDALRAQRYAPEASDLPMTEEETKTFHADPYYVPPSERPEQPQEQPKTFHERGTASSLVVAFLMPFLALSTLGVVVGGITGCSTARELNAVAVAETDGQRAFAAYGAWVEVQALSSELIRRPDVPRSVKVAIKQADVAGAPIATGLMQAYRSLVKAKEALQAGAGSSVAVEQATNLLRAREQQLAPYTATLSRAIDQSKG